jgi:hypothetical protein
MKDIIEFLQGKKSYIISGLGFGIVGCFLLGFLDLDTTVAILGMLGFAGVATLRDAISKIKGA